jgi:hypothetical protein
MQKIIGALFLISSLHAFAESTKPPAIPMYYGSYGIKTSVMLPNICISDICGVPAQSNLHSTKFYDRLNEYIPALANPNQTIYPPAVLKLYTDLQAAEQAQWQGALKTFKESPNLGNTKLDGTSRAMYNLLSVSPQLQKLKYKVESINGKSEVVLDEQASIQELKDLSPEERSWVLKIGKHFLSKSSSDDLSDSDVESKPPTILLKIRHPGASIMEALKAEMSEAQTAIAALKNSSPLEKAIYFTHTSPDRIALIGAHIEGGTVDENESRELVRWNIERKRSQAWFGSPDSPLLTKEPPPVEDIIRKLGGVEAITKALEADQNRSREKDDKQFQECKTQYFLNKGLLPNQEQIDTLNQDIRRSKNLVVELIKNKFPPGMHAKLIKAVEETTFITPPTAAEFERSFATNLSRKLETERANAEAVNKMPADEVRKFMTVLSLAASNHDANVSENDRNRFCGAFNFSPMSDANYTTYGSILLSSSTATGEEAARMKTIMHELGHTVSKTIDEDPQLADRLHGVRTCLANQHSEETPPGTKKWFNELRLQNSKAEGPYVEEDFADSVAGEAGRNIKGRNPWCPFMNLTYDRQQYQESDIQANDGDTHSSHIFRLLNFEMMKKGGLPESCRSFLAYTKFSGSFAACLDPASSQSSSPTRATGVNK